MTHCNCLSNRFTLRSIGDEKLLANDNLFQNEFLTSFHCASITTIYTFSLTQQAAAQNSVIERNLLGDLQRVYNCKCETKRFIITMIDNHIYQIPPVITERIA